MILSDVCSNLVQHTKERGWKASLIRKSEDVGFFCDVNLGKPSLLWHESALKTRLMSWSSVAGLKKICAGDPRLCSALFGSVIWTGFTCFIIYRTLINLWLCFQRFFPFGDVILPPFSNANPQSDNWKNCVYFCVITICAHKQNVSSEVLRQYGLSLVHSHIVLLTRTRACPLEQPAQPPPVPRWKLIRMPKKTVITDEPQGSRERKNEYDRKKSQEQKVVEGKEGGGCRGGYQTNGKAEMLDRV